MGLKYKLNASTLEISIQQICDMAVKGAAEKMRRKAIKIRDLAREYAPIKSGSLRAAIDYTTLRDDRRRKQFIVFVDPDYVANMDSGKVVGDYALIIERGLRPYGDGSAGTARIAGGGRFMSRSFKEVEEELKREVGLEVKRIIAGGNPLLNSVNSMRSAKDYGDSE